MGRSTFVIQHCQIVDGAGRPPIQDGMAVLRGQRIAAVGSAGEIAPPEEPDVCTIDARGGTLLPGLIDMHVHLSSLKALDREAGLTPRRVGDDVLRTAVLLRQTVQQGITTLRDCGHPHHAIFALREAIQAGEILGPRLVLCGRAICTTGGHGNHLSVQADGPDAVRAAVRGEIRAGADWIKLMATGGTATPGERTLDVQFTVAEMAAAVDEAVRRGKKVCTHCSCLAGAQAVLQAGVHSIEHGIELDEGAVATMRERDVALIPTLACTRIEAEAGPESGIPAFTRVRARPAADSQARSFQMATSAGVTIATGTDAGPFYLPVGMPSLIRELKTMVSLGMTHLEALEATTRVASEVLGLDEEIGTVEVGKLADLLLVNGDPLTDIDTLGDVQAVFKSGALVFERAPSSPA
jgi:imidazolonepropionase-like amidohydrolase